MSRVRPILNALYKIKISSVKLVYYLSSLFEIIDVLHVEL